MQEDLACIRDGAAVLIEFDVRFGNERVSDAYAEAAGKVVVTGARQPERRIMRAGPNSCPNRPVPRSRGKLRDRLQQMCDVGRCEPMIAVPPTLLHEQQTGIQQPSEVGACGLWSDPGIARKFARGQRPAGATHEIY